MTRNEKLASVLEQMSFPFMKEPNPFDPHEENEEDYPFDEDNEEDNE